MLTIKGNKNCKPDIDISGVMIHSAISLSMANGESKEEAKKKIDDLLNSKYGILDDFTNEKLNSIKNKYLDYVYDNQDKIEGETQETLFVGDELIDFDNSGLLKTENDILKLLKGNQSINNALNNLMHKNILLGTMVDLNKGTIVRDNIDLTNKIEEFKFNLLKNLNPNIDKRSFTPKKIQETLNATKFKYKVQKLDSNQLNEINADKLKLNEFISFVILSNFDELLKIKFSSIISINKQNNIKVKDKYRLASTKNLGSGFTDENLLFTHTHLTTSLLNITPIINFDGTVRENEYLSKEFVVSVFNKLKPIMPLTNIEETLGHILAELIRMKLPGGDNLLNKSKLNTGYNSFDYRSLNLNDNDFKVIFSMYNMFFKDDHYNETLDNNEGIASEFLKNINKINKYSFYQVYDRNDTNLLDLFDTIVSTLSKTVPTVINEVSYDHEKKSLLSKDISTTIVNKYKNEYKSIAFNRILQDFTEDKDIDYDLKNGSVSIKLKSGNSLYYNVKSGKIELLDKDSSKINLSIPSVTNNDLLNGDTYNDFSEIVKFIDSVTRFGITKSNCSVLNQLLNSKDTGKIDRLNSVLSIAMNIAFVHKMINEAGFDAEKKLSMTDKDLKKVLLKSSVVPSSSINKKFMVVSPLFNQTSNNGIENLIEAVSVVKGDAYKSTINDNSGNSQPTYGLASPISNFVTSFQQIKTEDSKTFRENPLIKHLGLMNNISRRGSIKNNDGTVVGSDALTIADTIMYDIKHDFLQSKFDMDVVKFQPTTFSDKNSHVSIHINCNTPIITARKETKEFGKLTSHEQKELFFNSQKEYYNGVKENFIALHNRILNNESLDLAKEYFNGTTFLNKILNGVIPAERIKISEFRKNYPDDFDSDVSKEIEEFNIVFDFMISNKQISSIGMLKSIAGLFNYKIYSNMAKKTFSGTNVDFLLEYHGRPGSDGRIEFNKPILNSFETYSPDIVFNDIEIQDLVDNYNYRYDGSNLYDEHDNLLNPNYTSLAYEKLIAEAKMRFIKSLNNSNIVFNVTDNKGIPDSVFSKAILEYKLGTWFDKKSQRLIISENGVLNPMLDHYFSTQKIVESFQQLTVGSIEQHKGMKDNTSEEVAAKTIAMYKRMVAHQATMHLYQQNKLNGIQPFNKVVYIKDPSILLTNILGETNEQDIPDGAGYTYAPHRVLEQNSLNDQVAEYQGHKSISIQMNNENGQAGLGKWAQYSISNQLMRMSPELSNLSRKMALGDPLKTEGGTEYYKFNIKGKELNLDLTVDYKGNKIPMFKQMKGLENGLFYKSGNGEVIEILSMTNTSQSTKGYSPSSKYVLKCINHNTNIEFDQQVEINTVYDLWNVLGGMNSISPSEDGNIIIKDNFGNEIKNFKYDESSNYAVSWFLNNIGCYKPKKTYKKLNKNQNTISNYFIEKVGEEYFDERINHTELTKQDNFKIKKDTQLSVWQPLKEMYVAQTVFNSAQKVGAKNSNDGKVIKNTDSLWITQKVPTLYSGIQLDYGHHIDESEVTEMTQIISAAVFNGETPSYAENIYNTIAKFVKMKIDPIIKGLNSNDLVEKRNILNKLEKEVVNNFIGETDVVARDIMNKTLETLNQEIEILSRRKDETYGDIDEANNIQDTLDKLNKIKEQGFNIAVSDQALYNKIFSTVASYFTKLLIRRKPTGIASVIMPSTNFIKVRTVPMFDNTSDAIIGYNTVNESEYIDYLNKLKSFKWYQNELNSGVSDIELQNRLFRKQIQPSELSMGMTILKGDKEIYITSILDIYDVLKNHDGTPLIQLINAPRELQTSNAFWTIQGTNMRYSMQQNSNTAKGFVTKDFAKKVNDIFQLNKLLKDKISNNRKIDVKSKIDKITKEIFDNIDFYRNNLPKEIFRKYFNETTLVLDGSIKQVKYSTNEINNQNESIKNDTSIIENANLYAKSTIDKYIQEGLIKEICN